VDHRQGEKPPGVTGQLAAQVAGDPAVAGRQLSPRPPGGSPAARRAAALGPPGTGPRAVPAVPLRVPRLQTPSGRPTSRQAFCRRATSHIAGTGMPRIVRAAPSTRKGTRRSFLTAPQKGSSGPTLARGASGNPAGLTARARPKARPPSTRQTSTTEDPHLRGRLRTRR
jgi:hypothetical protein